MRTRCLLLCLLLALPASVWAQFVAPVPPFRTVTEDTLPASCIAGEELVKVRDADASSKLRVCSPEGDGWETLSAPGGMAPTTGLRLGPETILSQKHDVTDITSNLTLGQHNVVWVTVGSSGRTITLPAAATTTTGSYVLRIKDTGTGMLTLVPNGSDTLNGVNAPRTVAGQRSGFDVRWLSATEWEVEELAAGGPLCMAIGGSTNNSNSGSGAYQAHDLTCVIPANTLQQGARLESCAMWSITTTATSAVFRVELRAGATPLVHPNSGNSPTTNVTGRTSLSCFHTLIAANPGAAVNTYSAVEVDYTGSSMGAGTTANDVTQPVSLATNGALTLTMASRWDAAGSGNTATLVGFWVTLHR